MSAETVAVTFEDMYGEMLTTTEEGVRLATATVEALVQGDQPEDVQPPDVVESVNSYNLLLNAPGKRLRGILTQLGYRLYGGSDPEVMRAASGVVEAMHAYVLIVDDIADKAELRRGTKTAHTYLRDYFIEQGVDEDEAIELGKNMANTTALTAQHRVRSLIRDLDIDEGRKSLAFEVLDEGIARTGIGQLRDMRPKNPRNFNVKDALRTATDKTAYYSILLPLQVGAALAGASREEIEDLREYAENAGRAFQLIDDIIGIYGSQEEIGKSPKSDTEEGKETVLAAKALEYAAYSEDLEEQERLLSIIGKIAITEDELEEVRKIYAETGALDETGREAWGYYGRAIIELQRLAEEKDWDPQIVGYIGEITLKAVKRNS